ncbi:MAG: hydantoinase/oxoprolinase, partial [Candidatus Eremiobacteraeota bacterium]|nr:hydantoinase/oxoprolinase [Candidatus Eremiobacteraeota bacterium]
FAVSLARRRGSVATAGHEVATTYGLRARTRTAVINAAILPRMERTSRLTVKAVAQAGIRAPLMIMRSDGGVMDAGEVARRPILTMLSGPAAGIAGALLHENVTDGIFIEVGGTSADCSVIRRGQPQMRPAKIGGHRTMLRTLDVRTLAIAGGSIPRIDPHGRGSVALRDVGPRSAHIAGLGYACFTEAAALQGARVTTLAPQPSDPDDYIALRLRDGNRVTVTPTCAANLLGYVAAGDFAHGSEASAHAACTCIAAQFGTSPEALATAILERAADKLGAAIDELIADYELGRADVELVGGGGGAAALVPFAAKRLGFRHRLARDAEVISPLGVALALVRDVVERTIVAPSAADVVRVRREAFERVVAAGAAPELVDVTIEIDARRNLVRAIASGATAATGDPTRGAISGATDCDVRKAAAARALHRDCAEVGELAAAGEFTYFGTHLMRAARARASDGCVVDARGVVRLVAARAQISATTAGGCRRVLAALLEETTSFGDVGRALPDVHLAYGKRLVDLGTLGEASHVLALAEEELRGLDTDIPVVIIAAPRNA